MSTIKEYLEEIQGRPVAVIGMGVSNTPLIKMLLRAGAEVTVRDRVPRERAAEQVQELESLGARMILGEEYLQDLHEDVIFRTPGLSPNTPELVNAVQRGIKLSSEMELFFQTCPSRLIGVTGSDGKTTTTTIIAEFLKEAGRNVYVGGNIGKPLLPDVADMVEEDFAVLELSSFQLMTMEQSPHIAVVTNLSPNHLDYHHTIEEYVRAKKNIFLHQGPEYRLILNYDNAPTRALAREAVCPVTFFSRQERLEEGVYLRDGAIWLTNDQGSREVLPLELIQLPGDHNVENYMAAIAAVDGLVPDRCVRAVVRRFQGVEHRIEFVRELDGVRWYNDSIGTSPSRTTACLESFDRKVVLIAGGYDKGIPFTQLGMEIVDRVKALILTGDTASAIRSAAEQAPSFEASGLVIREEEDLAAAVRAARETAREGDVVVLSPACAAGHSLGEYSALAAAGSLSPESALELVSLRGKLMADADPDGKGGMAAILKLNREAVNEIAKAAAEATGEILIVANHNTPAQFVISGTKAAVEAALPLVKEKKGRAVPLPVSGAFHSPLMDTAAQELAKALNKMTWSRPRFPVYSNVTGKAVTDGESLRELATVQMISSVLWIDTIANQWHDGIRSWVEVGPKGTLSRMVKPILDAVPVEEEVAITAVGSLEGVNAFA